VSIPLTWRDDPALVALPGIWGDSVVEVTIDPQDFEGSLTLVHRYSGPGDWEGFAFTTENSVQLPRYTASELEVRDQSSLLFFREVFTMSSSAVAGHFKGVVSGDVVLHGHGDSGEEGRVGLLIEGVGKLNLSALQASKAESH
jgi:hypothetical protein